ncbi:MULTISPECIES: hypothetical protein [Bacillaceae]|uniref:hypothetical protein n=1 Tax=Bacillaceae TaxID=186817 RepID=UPI000BFE9210|nr:MULTISPECIES: hypothetical protein [Bacillaceae]MCM3164144.1 hypothetical protein [Metabacillus litoralis]PGT84047.1 hypothetical protein COD11_11495 [Bacillus sp. AFS040349]UGB33748.1 hypothetical protein LPC09_26215 [Metabacillus sp. B2-18]
MNQDQYRKHQNAIFPIDLIEMFTDIIESDTVSRKVFIHIGRTLKSQKDSVDRIHGVTVNDIVSNVQVERKERVTKGKSFIYKPVTTNIDRKAAERIVDKLLDMSLLYYEEVKPYKFLFMTSRGWQITEAIVKRNKYKKGVEISNG